MKKLLALILGAGVLLSSCATNNRGSQTELKKLIAENNYAKAIELVNSSDFLKEQNNDLLRIVERGRVFFLNQSYFQALQEFDKARDLSEKLFTISVSKKATSALVNDNADNYYGENYEKSMIRYYQSLTHLMLYMKGENEAYSYEEKSPDGKITTKKDIPAKALTPEEIKFHFTAAKNILLDWDTYIESVKAVTGGEVTFKDDLMAKIYGAFIHENAGSATDSQIAKDLYKSAKDILLKNYDIYQVYNSKYKDFRKDFSKFAVMPIEQVTANYVVRTEYQNDLLKYIDQKIDELSKGVKNNILFVVEEGFIQEKKVKKFDIPLGGDKNSGSTQTSIPGDSGFVPFAIKVIGNAKEALPKIYFELPEVPMPTLPQKSNLIIESMDGKTVQDLKLQLVDPMNDIANQALDEKTTGLYLKTGTRVAGKHLVALIAAYEIYKKQKDKGDFIAMSMATLSYNGANKLIEMSEQADLRSWQTLPANFKLVATKLPVGEYKLKISTNGVIRDLKTIKIADANKPNIITLKN